MLDTARVLATQPVMRGPRVAVLANARSPETLSRAALTTAGLIPVDATRRRSTGGRRRPSTAPPCGPRSTPTTSTRVMVVHAPPLAQAVAAPVAEIDTAAADSTKPVVAVLMGGRNGPLRIGSPLPAFAFPEPAAAVLGRSYLYGTWLQHEAGGGERRGRRHRPGRGRRRDRRRPRARGDAARHGGGRRRAVGLRRRRARRRRAARPATPSPSADAIGYPVAVKAQRRHLGRSVRAGVALDLGGADDVTHALAVMQDAIGDDAANVVVQQMVAPGLDLRIRTTTDDRLGPLVAIGLGSSTADLVADEASRLAPLSWAGAGGAARRVARRAGARSAPTWRPTPSSTR